MAERKKKNAKSDETVDKVLGVAWYTREQYERLLKLANDRDNVEDTYEEWQATAEIMMVQLSRPGVLPRKVHVDVDELASWCKSHNRLVDGASRTVFVANKLEEEIGRKK